MSYCRFAPECDVYAFYDGDGVCVHVASRGYPDLSIVPRRVPFAIGAEEEWLENHAARNAWCEAHEPVPLNLGHDGESHYGLEFDEAAELLRELKQVGYRVPNSAIVSLLEEARESGAIA